MSNPLPFYIPFLVPLLDINRLCSATFEQLLAFSATFRTASNGQQLEQLLPSLAAFESTNS